MGRLVNTFIVSKHHHLKIDFDEFRLARPDFEKKVIKIREKYGVRPDLFNVDTIQSNQYGDELMSYLDNSRLDIDVQMLLTEFHLLGGWYQIIFWYVVSNGFLSAHEMLLNNPGGLVINEEDNGFFKEITLNIGSETTHTEYLEAWNKIKEIRAKKVNNSFRVNSARDLRIFKLHKQGKTLSEIYNTIKEKYGEDLDYGNIKKVISETYDRCHTPKEMRDKQKTK